MPTPPLLFMDIDGPLNPYAAPPSRRPPGYTTHRLNGHRVWLNPSHGPLLRSLPYTLAWGSWWKNDANTYVSPLLGLPDLPVCALDHDDPRADRHVNDKTPAIVHHAAGRPFAWFDDEIGEPDQIYVHRAHPGRALLLPVNPATGLEPEHFAALSAFARRCEEHP